MRLYAIFEENTVFDVIAQKIVDPKTIKLGRGNKIIPFAEHISIRKLKPRERFSHKIGDRWISSRRVSFAYLVAYYMLKNNKTVLAGFFDRGNGKYIFMEIKVGNMTIDVRCMLSVDGNPKNFMVMAGRQYDGIFGDAALSMEPDYINIPYEKLLSEVTIGITPVQAAAVLLIVAVVTCAFLFYSGVFTKKKAQPQMALKARHVIPPFTSDEIRALSILITNETLVKYKLYIDTLPEDIALRSATIHIVPVADTGKKEGVQQELKGVLSFQFESFYPFRGSKKSGDFFVFKKELVFVKHKSDVQKANEIIDQAKTNKKSFETLIDFCNVTARSKKEWKFAIAEKDYKNAVKILNDIYLSPVVIEKMTIGSEKIIGELTYHKL